MSDESDSSNESIIETLNKLKNLNNNEITDKIKNLFNQNILFENNKNDEKNKFYKIFNYNFGSWSNDETRLIDISNNVLLLTKNKNISLNVELKQCANDDVFKNFFRKYVVNYLNKYDKYAVSSKFINKVIIQNILNDLTENSLKMNKLLIIDSGNNMDGYILQEKVSIDTTLANLNLNDIIIVHKNKKINNNDVKCFFILSQLLDAFKKIEDKDFNHGKLTAHNIIVDINNSYISREEITLNVNLDSSSTKSSSTKSSSTKSSSTTEAPSSSTTESPSLTTEAPSSSTTESPSLTTEAPSLTTEAPSLTTEASSLTTEPPSSSTTEAPSSSTTGGPSSTTKGPFSGPSESKPLTWSQEKSLEIDGGGKDEIQTNFKIKLNNFSNSSITYNGIRYTSDFPKRIGILKENFTKEDYEFINKFYQQLNNNKIKNTMKNETFKKMLRHSPIPVPFGIEFYILIISMMLCNDVFFNFFRKYYFDLLFDNNLTNANLDDVKNNNNKMIKSCVSYKIYKLIIDKKNNKNTIDLPLTILRDIFFKLQILNDFNEKNKIYMKNIIDSIKNENEKVDVTIDKVISEINNITGSISADEIPDKIIIYVNPNLRDKDLINYYNKPFIFNFDPLNKYEEDKMNDVNASFFKDKNTFKSLVDRFNSPTSKMNIYNAEISNGVVDNNILLTIKKSFSINSKIKLSNGKIYTIIDAKWEPEKWVKKKFSEIDKKDKIKKKITEYDIPKDVLKKIKKSINLNYKTLDYNELKQDVIKSNVYIVIEPENEKKILESINLNLNFSLKDGKEILKSMNIFSNKNKISIKETEHDDLKKMLISEKIKTIEPPNSTYLQVSIKELTELPDNILTQSNNNFINIFYSLFYSSVIDNTFYNFLINHPNITNNNMYNIDNFYNKFEIYDKKDDKSDDKNKNTNIDDIIKKNINNDEKYNDNLKKNYDEIKKNTNVLHSEFLKFELIFLKTCYNYYYLCNEIKKKIEEKHENLKIPLLKNFNNMNDVNFKGIQPVFVKKICDELFNLKYLYEYSNLMYNYYLYGLYWWIAANMKAFNEEIFTKEKIIKNFFSGKSIIDQKKYDTIINNKRKIFLEILDSLFKFEKFYKNNESIEKFRKNKLMSILFESSYDDSLSSTNILYTQLQEKITNNINLKRTITTEEYKLINVKNDRNCFLYCLIYALRNKIKEIDDYPLYDKDIIQAFIDSSNNMISDSPIKYNCDELRNKIIDSVEFKVEYYKTKKEKNRDFFISLFSNVSSEIEQLKKMYNDDEQIFEYFKTNENYMLNDFMIHIIAQIFNCMFYVYSSISGKQPTLKNVIKYNNQPYSIIFYKDDEHYKLIEYMKNSSMTCEELPEELQMGQYCYYEPLIAEPLSNISMIGGGPIDDKMKQEIDVEYSKIEAKKSLIKRFNEELKIKRDEYNKNISLEEKNKIKSEIKNKEDEIKNNTTQLLGYYEEIIKKNIELVKEYKKDEINNSVKIINTESDINKYKNELNKLKINFYEKFSKEKNKKVYGIVVDLILYPGENPSMIEKQNYKCKKSFDDLKNEYCEVFGIGCSEKNKKNGGTMKNKITNKKKYTMKNKII